MRALHKTLISWKNLEKKPAIWGKTEKKTTLKASRDRRLPIGCFFLSRRPIRSRIFAPKNKKNEAEPRSWNVEVEHGPKGGRYVIGEIGKTWVTIGRNWVLPSFYNYNWTIKHGENHSIRKNTGNLKEKNAFSP